MKPALCSLSALVGRAERDDCCGTTYHGRTVQCWRNNKKTEIYSRLGFLSSRQTSAIFLCFFRQLNSPQECPISDPISADPRFAPVLGGAERRER